MKPLAQLLLAATCLAMPLFAAAADPYPNKPIHLIVPYPSGGTVETLARLIGDRLGAVLGQPVVVESRGGAAGNIGSQYVASSPPDGYTLVLGTQSSHGTNKILFKETRYDPVKDFEPITMIADAPLILVVNPKTVDVKDVQGLIQFIKSKPNGVDFASASTGGGGHLAGERFKKLLGLDMVHVPYKGSGPARADLLGGHVTMMFDNIASSLPAAQAGQLRALAVTSAARSSVAPEIPTMAEAGVKDFVIDTWYALYAPAKTPAPIIARLNTEVVKILKTQEVADRLRGLGMDVSVTTPEGLRDRMKTDLERYTKIINDAGIQAE